MIELQTLVGNLTIAEFTKLCGMIGGAMFLLCFLAVAIAYSIYCFICCIGYFIAIVKKLISIRKKEKQDN